MNDPLPQLQVAIVDDEPLARGRLQRLLGRQSAVRVIGEFGDGASAAAALVQLRCDLVFLDVRMPEVDGFAMLDRLPEGHRPLVVFVTAHSEHALRAFDTWAVDYLMKPVSEARLVESLARARERLAFDAANSSATPSSDYPERLVVPDGARIRVVPTADIEMVLAQGNYVELRTAARNLLLRETMNSIEQRLDPRVFLRIHRSRIVRIDLIEQIEPYGAGQFWLRLRNGACTTSGRSYRQRLLRAYGMAA